MEPGCSLEIASVTKTITATATTILVRRGLIELGETLGAALPRVLAEIGAPDFWERVTVYQLLRHTG
jgi:CubicO group peptidase (beta-lactamase class C family)